MILVGSPGEAIEEVPRDAAWIDRPVTRDAFLLSVALGLAEGRPSRRSPRKLRAEADVVDRRRLVEGHGRQRGRRAPGDHGRLAVVAAAVLHVEGSGIRRRDESEAGLGRDADSGLGVVRRSHRAPERRDRRDLEELHLERARAAGRRSSMRE